MRYEINHKDFRYITDNSNECDENTAFFLCEQNKKYLQKAKQNNPPAIIMIDEYKKLLDIDDIKIIGITGTNGKTTTAAIIYSLLLDLGYGCALQGTRGVFINDEKLEGKTLTTPLIFNTLNHIKEAKDRGCEYFVMEVSSHAIVQNRIEGLEFALKVFTNLTQDHLDYHKTFEEYKRVKESFFLDETPKLINKDAKKINFNIKNAFTYALDLPATYNITSYTLKDGISAVVRNFDKMEHFHSNLYGLFNVYNLLAAIASVSITTKKPLKEICEQVENFAGVSGRMEVISQEPLIIVDFAHTPDGMDKVLDSLKDYDISLVFGAGGDRDKSKRPQMGRVANRYAKKIYLTSDNPRSEDPQTILDEIEQGITNKDKLRYKNIDRKKAIQKAYEELEDKEILVVLGKGDEDYQEIDGVKHPFDDREILRELFKSDATNWKRDKCYKRNFYRGFS